MDEATKILAELSKGIFKPLYFLMGEEPYFIDQISDYIEEHVLSDDEKAFNQMVLYGRDVSIDDIASNAKRYPMMAERQVVIVKEAQDLSRSIDKLLEYSENLQPSTILVICYKYKKVAKNKKLYKSIKNNGVIVEFKSLYENKVAAWITSRLQENNFSISPKAAQMLVEFLGNDLNKIDNELQKLQLISEPGTTITPELIEENIGISKDFNNFELQNAVGARDEMKAHRIINYFAQNQKDHPMVMTVSLLYSFFSKLLQYHGLNDKSQAAVIKVLKVHPYFVKDYVVAARNYPMRKVSQIVSLLREADLKSKGVDVGSAPHGDLLKELVVKVMR